MRIVKRCLGGVPIAGTCSPGVFDVLMVYASNSRI